MIAGPDESPSKCCHRPGVLSLHDMPRQKDAPLTQTPHVGKEPSHGGKPTITDTILAAGLAVLFIGVALYAGAVVGGFGWAVAVAIGFLGIVAAQMAYEQTRDRLAVRKAEGISVGQPDVWPAIGSPDDTNQAG